MANDKHDDTGNKPIEGKKPAAKKAATTKKSATRPSAKKTSTRKAAPDTNAEKASAASAQTTSEAAAERPKIKNEKRTRPEGRRSEDRVMPGLLKNLQAVFEKIHSDNRIRDRSHDKLAEEFTTQMQRVFLEMHKQIEEHESLLEKQLKGVDRTHQSQWKSMLLISVPVTLLSIIAIVYLFYVVHVMERSMTSMSKDMHIMSAYMETLTTDTTSMSVSTATISLNTQDLTKSVSDMNNQITTLNNNVGNMMVDMNNMSRSVSPAMKGMNRFIP